MASIFDQLLNLRPRGLPSVPDNPAGIGDAAPIRASFAGLDMPAIVNVHPVNPYKPPVGGGTFPPVPSYSRVVPPNRSTRLPPASAGLGLARSIAPDQSVRKGISHPGRRLGHTGNPGAHVGRVG